MLAGMPLLMAGTAALAEIEDYGFRVDLGQVEATREWALSQIKKIGKKLEDFEEFDVWERTYGRKMNLDSGDQLAVVLFDKLGHTPLEFGKNRASTDESALEKLNIPFLKLLLHRKKLAKLEGTFLHGIARECDDAGLLHASFNLHLVKTFRSSCDGPNLQNIPVRNPLIMQAVRQCFIPREGHRLIECDYSSIEVRCAEWYTHDPMLRKYIEDPTTDMHRDMAAECYMLRQDQVEKLTRSFVKGLFVFAEFYGDRYFSVARGLWEAIGLHGLKVGDTSLYAHLASKGVSTCGACNPRKEPARGSFESHIKAVEESFWGQRFKHYARWKENIYDLFLRQGHVDTLTGFRLNGPATRNEILNAPIQGTAFHCLLWSLVKLHASLKKRGLRARIVCQIHDSIILDVHEDDVSEVLELVNDTMTKRILKDYKFISTPMKIEAEACGVGESWADKKPLAI